MFDSALPSDLLPIAAAGLSEVAASVDLPPSVRVDTRLSLTLSGASGSTRLTGRREEGAFRFRFPRGAGPGSEAMLVNVAGGLAGGDRVLIAAEAREGASLTLSAAAAERVYRSAGAETLIRLDLRASGGSTLLWLPQETILQDGARLGRRIDIDLSGDATLLLGEMLYFGRAASGERFTHGRLAEAWRLTVDGRLVLADFTRIAGDFSTDITRPAALGKARAMATILFAHKDAGESLAGLRAALALHPTVESGASDLSTPGRSGLVIARLLAEDGTALRAAFLDAVHAVAPKSTRLPRTLVI